MQRISVEKVELYWLEVNTQSDEKIIHKNLKKLYDEQLLLMTWLTVVDKDSLTEDERHMVYYLGAFVVHVMLCESPIVAEVTEQLWDQVRGTNIKMLEFLATEDSPKSLIQSMHEVIEANQQKYLLRFMVELIMNDPQCQKLIREENVWRVFSHLKIVVDCLDKVGVSLSRAVLDERRKENL